MAKLVLFIILWIAPSILCLPQPQSVERNFQILTRQEWGGRPPVAVTNLNLPVPFVIIHHTYIPGPCYNFIQCSAAMRSMQNYHQLQLGWEDIGYNFAIGSDGNVYEGPGWNAVGAHARGFNSVSIGIALIGDWRFELPPQIQMDAAKKLIQEGVRLGYISKTYDLIGHLQVVATQCPGEALFKEISTWDRFRPNM